jgi:hypothetical protein
MDGGKTGRAMQRDKQLERLQARHARLAAQLAAPGLALQGSINEVRRRRPDPAGKGMKTYGPYYQWTWKQAGKTVTVNLSASQRRAFQCAIDNHRKLESRLAALRTLSRQILELTTDGVFKRNR